MIPVIQTCRTTMQIVDPCDLPDTYFNGLNDPQIIGFTEARHQKWSKDKAIRFLNINKKTRESLIFSVKLKKESKLIGNIRLFNINKIHHRCELSFLFFDKTEWFKGYATESVGAICDYSFDQLFIHRIHADYYAENLASKKLFKKLGFSIEGVFKDHFFYKDRFIDSIRVAKLKGNK